MTGDSVIKPFARVETPSRPRNGQTTVIEPRVRRDVDLVPLEIPVPTPAPVVPRKRIHGAVWLAALQGLLVMMLVWIELAQPPPQPGFAGIIFSNAINSTGARAGMSLYRETLDWLPFVGDRYVLSPKPYLYSRQVIFILLAAIQVAALWHVCRDRHDRLRRWLIGPVITTALLVLYPPINTDVFYYASAGEVANNGGNPYITSPRSFGAYTFHRFSDWEHITVPYGPVWTGITRAVVYVTGTDPFWTSLGFKILLGSAGIALALMTALIAKTLTGDPRRGVLAFVLMAWSPILLYESAGTAHLDPLLMLPALAGLLLIVSSKPGRMRAGLLLIALSALFKPVTVALLGSAALLRLARHRVPLPRLMRQWALDVVSVLALVALAFAPYWAGGKLPTAMLDNQRELYVEHPLRSNPFWIWLMPRLGFSGGWLPIDGAKIAQTAATLLGVIAVVWLVRREYLLRSRTDLPDPTPPMLLRWEVQTWAVIMVALAYIPPNSHSWYMIWAMPLVAVIAVDRIRATSASTTGSNGHHAPGANGSNGSNGHANGHAVSSALSLRSIPWPIILFFAWSFANFFIYHTFWRG